MPRPTFTNDYAADGKDLRAATRAESGHRCIRCGHPYMTGIPRPDRGEWSDCDERCRHSVPVRLKAPDDLAWVTVTKPQAMLLTVSAYIELGGLAQAQWRILTVHHFDGNKANDAWWNQLPLCQKCHLQFQNKVDPNIPFFFEHSEWLKPYVAGFYAKKYEGADLTREQVNSRLDQLLAWECKIPNDSRATRILAAGDAGSGGQHSEGPAAGENGGADRSIHRPDLGNL